MNQLSQTITSNEVADMIGKEHSKLIRDIRTYIGYLGEAKIGSSEFFIESTYKSEQNKDLPNYLLTKQGCELVSNKLTGAKGVQFTAKYVSRFNQMEENTKQQSKVATTPREQVLLALSAGEETNQRVDDIDDRLTDIEENKLITTEDKGTVDRHVRKKVYQICKEQRFGQDAKSMLFQDLGSSIKRLFQVPNRGRIKDKDFTRVLEFIDNWQPSSVTKEQIKQLEFDFDDIA
ncbi:Rha family transcriptional regulator [Enterococcus avium]|uniref:Rha family transcriptional regulator n=1 Tax=Enterococcus avium TaxID=33945 RepID=UPI0028928DFE|nr:Rha family transcriptional regulator [Enterococcus avium]MDT2466649.1 Rha family transcriptional regulator [Enterococcus avium]MDT2506107.1 Rha family transcriptional regulator [Enterococcus avium]